MLFGYFDGIFTDSWAKCSHFTGMIDSSLKWQTWDACSSRLQSFRDLHLDWAGWLIIPAKIPVLSYQPELPLQKITSTKDGTPRAHCAEMAGVGAQHHWCWRGGCNKQYKGQGFVARTLQGSLTQKDLGAGLSGVGRHKGELTGVFFCVRGRNTNSVQNETWAPVPCVPCGQRCWIIILETVRNKFQPNCSK